MFESNPLKSIILVRRLAVLRGFEKDIARGAWQLIGLLGTGRGDRRLCGTADYMANKFQLKVLKIGIRIGTGTGTGRERGRESERESTPSWQRNQESAVFLSSQNMEKPSLGSQRCQRGFVLFVLFRCCLCYLLLFILLCFVGCYCVVLVDLFVLARGAAR